MVKRNYAIAALFVMTSMVHADTVSDKIADKAFRDNLRKKYEEGLKKVAAADLKRLEDTLKFAARMDIEIF